MPAEDRSNIFTPYDETARRALICDSDPEIQKKIASLLLSLRLRIEAVCSMEQLIESVKYNHYDIVIVQENFSCNAHGDNEALRFFEEMPMSSRRSILIVLLSQKLPTLDNLTAYAYNVNVIVNVRDVAKLAAIIAKSASENERFFRALKESLSIRGRA